KMERIQFVQEALREIDAKYDSFFRPINKSICMYLDIKESIEGGWVNVTVKKNAELPPQIVDEIKERFFIRN
ncbi:MAG TPA: hypothetical protein VIJ27_09140, partial [Mucilaginibacter sp.]